MTELLEFLIEAFSDLSLPAFLLKLISLGHPAFGIPPIDVFELVAYFRVELNIKYFLGADQNWCFQSEMDQDDYISVLRRLEEGIPDIVEGDVHFLIL